MSNLIYCRMLAQSSSIVVPPKLLVFVVNTLNRIGLSFDPKYTLLHPPAPEAGFVIAPVPRPVPKTGDRGKPGLWIGLVLLGILGMLGIGLTAAGRRKQRKR